MRINRFAYNNCYVSSLSKTRTSVGATSDEQLHSSPHGDFDDHIRHLPRWNFDHCWAIPEREVTHPPHLVFA